MKTKQSKHPFLLLIGAMCIILVACAKNNEVEPTIGEPAPPDIPTEYIDAMERYKVSRSGVLRIHGDILVTGTNDNPLSEFFVLSFLCDVRKASGEYSKQLSVEIWKTEDNDAVFLDSSSSQFVNLRGLYASASKILDDENITETAKTDLRESMKTFSHEIINGKMMADTIGCEYIDDCKITDDTSWQNTWGADFNDESTTTGTVGEKNALKKAKQYLEVSAFSYQGLIDQLKYEGYTDAESIYGVNNCGADWNEQAAKKAKQYLDLMAFSREGLIEQLEFEGFTHSQAIYGVEANGY